MKIHIVLNFLLVLPLISKSIKEAPLKVIKYRNEDLLAFENLGEMHPIEEIFEVKLVINLTDVSSLGYEILNRIEKVNNSAEVCKSTVCLIELAGIKSNIKKSDSNLQNIMKNQRRLRRDAFWSSGGEFLQSLMGTLTEEDGRVLVEGIVNIESQQRKIMVDVKTAKDLLLQSYDHLKAATDIVQKLSHQTKEEIDKLSARLTIDRADNFVITEIRMAAQKFENMVNNIVEMVFNKKLLGRLITFSQLDDIFLEIKNTAFEGSWFPLNSFTEAPLTEILIESAIMMVRLTVPAVSKDRFKIFEVKAFPIMIDGKLMNFFPEKNYIAINDLNRTMAFDSIENCLRYKKQLFCLSKKLNSDETCIETAFLTLRIDEKLCRKSFHIFDLKNETSYEVMEDNSLIAATLSAKHEPVRSFDKVIEPELKVRWLANLTIDNEATNSLPTFTDAQLEFFDQLGDKMRALNATDIETEWITLDVNHWNWKQYLTATIVFSIFVGILYVCCFRKC